MKNKKLLAGLLSASSIVTLLPIITSCSCSNQYNKPEVSSKTPKNREVGAKATRTYFLIQQLNIDQPEETKVKMINLKVNGASASVVSGLIKSYNDSAGNILVVFNMSIALKQYQADNITFDLKLTNKKANTEYTITDFSVIISDKSSAVTYNVDECPGIVWKQNPDTIGYEEDLDIQFVLESGYEWNTITSEDIDVTIDGKSIKTDLQTLEDNRSEPDEHYFYFAQDRQDCFIYVPKELIGPNSDIQITLKSHGVTYSVNHDAAGATQHIKYTGADQVTHPDDYKPTIEAESKYYTFDPANQSWDVVMNAGTAEEVSLKDSGAAAFEADKKTLKVNGQAILGDLTISAEAIPSTWSVSMTASTHMTAKTLADATYDQTDYSQDITVEPYYTYKLTSATVDDVEGESGKDISQYVHITHTTGTTTLNVKIDKEAIVGKINLVFEDDGTKFDVTSSTTDTEIQFEEGKIGTETAQYGVNYTVGVSCKDSWYVVDSSKFVVKCGGTAMTSGYSFANDTLTIDGDSIKGAIDIKAESKKKEFTVTNTKGDGITLTTAPTVAKYDEACEWVYAVDSTHTLDIDNVKATIAGSPSTELTIANGGLVHTPASNKIAIASDKLTSIKGNITFNIPSTTITVGGAITGLTYNSVESKYVGDTAILTFTVDDDYLLNKTDFTSGNAKIYVGSSASGTLIDASKLTIDDTAGTVTIAADVITENQLYLDGKLTQYKASVTEKSGQTGIFKSITKPEYATASADFVVSYELNTGYTTPTATVKVAGTTLTATTDYTITSTTLTIPKAKVTGKVEITELTASDTIKWADTFEDTVTIGSSSTYVYSATTIGGGQSATISTVGTLPSRVSFSNGRIVTDQWSNTGTVTLQATYSGAVTSQKTVQIIKPLTISGSNQIDYESGSTTTLSVTYGDTAVNASDCSWSIAEGSSVTLGTPATNLVVTKKAPGLSKIKCEYTPPSGDATITKYFYVDVASYNKLTIKVFNQQYAYVNASSGTGTFYVPAIYYDSSTSKIYNVTEIADSAFKSDKSTVSSIVLPDTLTTISSNAFEGQQFTSITLPNSVKYMYSYAFKDCSALKTITLSSSLDTIGVSCFNNCKALTSITIPASCKTIREYAFYNCYGTLSSVTFENQSGWITRSSRDTCNVSDPTTNAYNFTWSTTWYSQGIIRE